MMWCFWLVIFLMLAVAIIFVIFPFIRKQKQVLISQDEVNLQLYHHQLQHLETELENKIITPQIYQQLKAEVELGLSQDVTSNFEKNTSKFIKPNFILAGILSIFVVAFSLTIYFKEGNSKQLDQYYIEEQHAAAINAEIKTFKSPAQLIAKLTNVLQQHPDSARGWFLLGRLYMGVGQYQQAEQVFAKAVDLAPKNLTYKLQYAQADFFANNQSLSATASTYLNEVINKQPKNLTAVNLIALNAYANKHYQIAIDRWESLLPYFSASSPEGRVIMNAIAEAQNKL